MKLGDLVDLLDTPSADQMKRMNKVISDAAALPLNDVFKNSALSQLPDRGKPFWDEAERIMKSYDRFLPAKSAMDTLLSQALGSSEVFDEVSKALKAFTTTFADSEVIRSQVLKTSKAIIDLYETLPDHRLSGLSANLELYDGATELSEPSSVSVGVSEGDDLTETTDWRYILIVALMIVPILLALRPDPQLTEIAELLRIQNELLRELFDVYAALPTRGP